MTPSTVAPVSVPCLIAQASAALEGSDPSTPTTIRCSCSPEVCVVTISSWLVVARLPVTVFSPGASLHLRSALRSAWHFFRAVHAHPSAGDPLGPPALIVRRDRDRPYGPAARYLPGTPRSSRPRWRPPQRTWRWHRLPLPPARPGQRRQGAPWVVVGRGGSGGRQRHLTVLPTETPDLRHGHAPSPRIDHGARHIV